MNMRFLLYPLFFLPSFVLFAQEDDVQLYINKYKHIAISEMHRSGIPASITLAQGIFESSFGKSISAVKHNNHFGIKCKKDWTGKFYYKPDDDYDRLGNLIESCFRAYSTVEESFVDHTNFLVQRDRYQILFHFDNTDYWNWANGLQNCGYATNKKYAEKLISLIERYGLWAFDTEDHEDNADISDQRDLTSKTAINLNNSIPRETIQSVATIDSLVINEIKSNPVVAIKSNNRINRAIILPNGYLKGERKTNPSFK